MHDRSDMEPISITKEISDLFLSHEIPFHAEGEWIVPFSKLPAMRATWFQREGSGVLEIEVLLEDERIVNECFAGIGSSIEGIKDALQNFCVNSFHVFLAAFWELNDSDQVVTETWSFHGKKYTSFIGNFGTRCSAGEKAEIPEGCLESIQTAIQNSPLEFSVSWFRCFFCNFAGERTFEALKNNEVWELGLSALQSLNWKEKESYYSVRSFLIIKENA